MRHAETDPYRQTLLCLLLWFAAVLGVIADPVSDLKQSLSNTDAAVRAEAIRTFVMSLGTVNGQASMVPCVPVLIDALNDPDAKVRLYAISGLRGVLFLHSPLVYPSILPSQNPSTNPSLQPALLKATSDPDPEIRELALEAYAVTYKLTSELEDKIIAEFKSPDSEQPHQESQRPVLMESLMLSRSPSPKAIDFLTSLLNDPRWAPHVANSISADRCLLPESTLPRLASLLTEDKMPADREAYARAIGAYGKRAQAYRPQLEAALASETDEVTKQNIQRALDRIK
jgi:HEAT repeat protein